MAEGVRPETIEKARREEAAAQMGSPGAEGTRRALEDNAAGWARGYDAEVQRLADALERARSQAAFWHRIAAAVGS